MLRACRGKEGNRLITKSGMEGTAACSEGICGKRWFASWMQQSLCWDGVEVGWFLVSVGEGVGQHECAGGWETSWVAKVAFTKLPNLSFTKQQLNI